MIWSQVGFSNGALMDGPIPMHIWATKIEQDINFWGGHVMRDKGKLEEGNGSGWSCFIIYMLEIYKNKKDVIKSSEMLNIRFTE